ncbi:MAG: rRNA maturation RNase YbeY [Patescibacteria group bacterium]
MIEFNNLTRNRINERKVLNLVDNFLKSYRIEGDISIAVIGDCRMRRINNSYRGKDKTTDVLSFVDLNEILISFQQIKRQAKKYNKKVMEEFNFILVHGLLHLCGYKDEKELGRLEMIKLGNVFLDKYYKKNEKNKP